MSRDFASATAARSWRDIPQQVKPRAMSSEGRRRLVARVLGWTGGGAALLLAGWGAWQVAAVWRSDAAPIPAAAQAAPIRSIELETDGVLDQAWLERTLALPPHATLTGLDLGLLRDRIQASGQVSAAALIRNFPATLAVHLTERPPMARVMAEQDGGVRRAWLVSRDGVVFDGVGYDPAMLDSLPWLDGVKLTRQGRGFAPIDGMATAAKLLAQAKLEAEPLYRTWQVVSLARLGADGEIEVRTRGGLRVIFGTEEDFFRQLARLDFMLEAAPAAGPPLAEVNLALGPQVPATFAPAFAAASDSAKAASDRSAGGAAPSRLPPAKAGPAASAPFSLNLSLHSL
jgi:hypothetical protein